MKRQKKDFYMDIIKILGDNYPELTDFCQKQLKFLDKKADSAKVYAVKALVRGNALRDICEAVLTDDLQTLDEIEEQLCEEDYVTRSKIIAQISQLIRMGRAEKVTIKINGRRVQAYRRI